MERTTTASRLAGPGVPRAILETSRRLGVLAAPWLVLLALRVALAVPFWRSGILKWDGFLRLGDTAVYLFQEEFKLHLPGGPYAFPMPAVTAFITASAEIVVPVLLVLGIGTRFAAAIALVMVAVIQLTVPDGWPLHVTWAAMALALVHGGAGAVSADSVLARLFLRADRPLA